MTNKKAIYFVGIFLFLSLLLASCQGERLPLYMLRRNQDDIRYFETIENYAKEIDICQYENSERIIYDESILPIKYDEIDYILVDEQYYYKFQTIMDTLIDKMYDWQTNEIKTDEITYKTLEEAKIIFTEEIFNSIKESNIYQDLAQDLDTCKYRQTVDYADILPYAKRYRGENGDIIRFVCDIELRVNKAGAYEIQEEIKSDFFSKYWYMNNGNVSAVIYLYYDVELDKIIRMEDYREMRYRYLNVFTENEHCVKEVNIIYDDYLLSHEELISPVEVREINEDIHKKVTEFLQIAYQTKNNTTIDDFSKIYSLCSKRLSAILDEEFLNDHFLATEDSEIEFSSYDFDTPLAMQLNVFNTKYGDEVIQYDFVKWWCKVKINDSNVLLTGKDKCFSEDKPEYRTVFFFTYEDSEYKIDNWYTFVY